MFSNHASTLATSGARLSPGILLFVYGTLRRGFENHAAYLQDAQFLGRAVTQNKFALFLGDFPYLNRTPAVSCIVGEIYRVDERTLAHIDCLEGHPEEYRRELITVVTEQGIEYSAWTYFYPEPRGKLIQSGDYLDGIRP